MEHVQEENMCATATLKNRCVALPLGPSLLRKKLHETQMQQQSYNHAKLRAYYLLQLSADDWATFETFGVPEQSTLIYHIRARTVRCFPHWSVQMSVKLNRPVLRIKRSTVVACLWPTSRATRAFGFSKFLLLDTRFAMA